MPGGPLNGGSSTGGLMLGVVCTGGSSTGLASFGGRGFFLPPPGKLIGSSL